MWKDVLINKWCGLDPVITRSRGAISVFPQNCEDPIWVPARLTREIKKKDDPVELSVLLWKIRAEAAEMTPWAVSRATVSRYHLEQHPVQPLIS